MATPTASGTTPAKSPNGGALKKDGTPKKAPTHRERSPVEVASAKVMNLIGRLEPGDQRKVMAAVGALVSKAD